jgi:ribosomal protein S17E
MRVYGKLSPEAEQWLRTMNVVSKKFENHVAGFAHRARSKLPME